MYINARLPRRIAAGFKVGPSFRTHVVTLDSGREQRNRQWRYPKWRGSGNMAAFTPADRQALISIFVAVGGQWGAFRFHDPTDHLAANESIAPAVGSSTPVQLVRSYVFPGSATAIEVLVQAPVAGTVTVYRDGMPVAGTLDDQLGLFTPSAPWAAGTYTWSGQYDRWMRFENDWGALTAAHDNVYTADIELVEVRR